MNNLNGLKCLRRGRACACKIEDFEEKNIGFSLSIHIGVTHTHTHPRTYPPSPSSSSLFASLWFFCPAVCLTHACWKSLDRTKSLAAVVLSHGWLRNNYSTVTVAQNLSKTHSQSKYSPELCRWNSRLPSPPPHLKFKLVTSPFSRIRRLHLGAWEYFVGGRFSYRPKTVFLDVDNTLHWMRVFNGKPSAARHEVGI